MTPAFHWEIVDGNNHAWHAHVGEEWQNEDDIKAELRRLTSKVRQLREELGDMVAPPKANPSRAFLHRQSWPPPAQAAADRPPPSKSPGRKKNR